MRFSVSAAIGVAVLLMAGALCLIDGRVGAQEQGNVGPASFALYAKHVLHAGDTIRLSGNATGGYSVTLLSKEQAKRYGGGGRPQTATVKEVHSDYVVVQYEDRRRSFQAAISLNAMKEFVTFTVKDPN